MYIGTTGTSGLHHLIWEVFDNSRDEAMGGFANDIEVALLPDGSVRVADNGRGIPVDIHKQTKVSALDTIMTTLHAGGKFGGEGYKVSGGLHGVGASVVNALSTRVLSEIHRDGGRFEQEYKDGGKAVSAKRKSSRHPNSRVRSSPSNLTRPSSPTRHSIWDRIVSHMRQQAYLVRGLRISIIDLRGVERSR